MELIFKTPHGSHLYGLNHADSDEDFYSVYRREVKRTNHTRYKWAKQSIVDGVDTVRVDFGTWVRWCDKGVPQALEAMFSPVPIVDEISAYRAAYRVGITNMRDTYYRTMDNFVQEGSIKRKRHALRLFLNLRQANRYGRFNPRLTARQKFWVEQVAQRFDDETVLRLVLSNRMDNDVTDLLRR